MGGVVPRNPVQPRFHLRNLGGGVLNPTKMGASCNRPPQILQFVANGGGIRAPDGQNFIKIPFLKVGGRILFLKIEHDPGPDLKLARLFSLSSPSHARFSVRSPPTSAHKRKKGVEGAQSGLRLLTF